MLLDWYRGAWADWSAWLAGYWSLAKCEPVGSRASSDQAASTSKVRIFVSIISLIFVFFFSVLFGSWTFCSSSTNWTSASSPTRWTWWWGPWHTTSTTWWRLSSWRMMSGVLDYQASCYSLLFMRMFGLCLWKLKIKRCLSLSTSINLSYFFTIAEWSRQNSLTINNALPSSQHLICKFFSYYIY